MSEVPTAVTCPRCGHAAVPGAGPFCSYCGRYLAPLAWVAEPPPEVVPPSPLPPPAPYTGPPRYRVVPRWGFPPAPWQPPGNRAVAPDPVAVTQSLAATVVPMLWATAAVSFLAAAAESWRYALLLASRGGALSARAVAASDAFVISAGMAAVIMAGLAGVGLIAWTLRIAAAAAQQFGIRMSRSSREILAGWLVPGVNLAVPGAVLAEIEHMVLGLPPDARPRPSRLLRIWWVLWAAGGVLAVVVLVWSWRGGVQAMADGVLLHAVLDLIAVAVAVTSALVVVRLTRLLDPVPADRPEVLVSINP